MIMQGKTTYTMKEHATQKILGSVAVLRTVDGHFLYQRRDADATNAPNMVACFGGAANGFESETDTLRRELLEELDLDTVKQNLSMELLGYVENVPRAGYGTAVFLLNEVDDSKLVLHEGEAIVKVRDVSEIERTECSPFLLDIYDELQNIRNI